MKNHKDDKERDLYFISMAIEHIRAAVATLEIINDAEPDPVSRKLAIDCVLSQSYSALQDIDNILPKD